MSRNESTSPGVRVIYSVPASAPRVIFIPIARLWLMIGLLLTLLSWSALSAWLLFARYDLTLSNFLPASLQSQSETILAVPEADAPRAPAAASIPEIEVVPPSVVETATTQVESQASFEPLVLPEGKIEPKLGSGVALDLLHLKWNGRKAQLQFSVVNVSDQLMSGRIVARAEFRSPEGAVASVRSPSDLVLPAIGQGDVTRIDAGVGLSYATRRQVSKSLSLDAGATDGTLTALDVLFVDQTGAVQAVFRFP